MYCFLASLYHCMYLSMHSLYINLQIVHTCLYFLITSFAEPFDPSPDFKALVISSLYASYLAFHFVKDASGTWILKQGSFLISTYDVKKIISHLTNLVLHILLWILMKKLCKETNYQSWCELLQHEWRIHTYSKALEFHDGIINLSKDGSRSKFRWLPSPHVVWILICPQAGWNFYLFPQN